MQLEAQIDANCVASDTSTIDCTSQSMVNSRANRGRQQSQDQNCTSNGSSKSANTNTNSNTSNKKQVLKENYHQNGLATSGSEPQSAKCRVAGTNSAWSSKMGSWQPMQSEEDASREKLISGDGISKKGAVELGSHQAPAEAAEAADDDGAAAGEEPFKATLVWTNIILFVILHSGLPIGLYMVYTQRPWRTLIWSLLGTYASGLGVTGGSHRLWSHRSYKASWPVQVLLVILQTMAGQNSVYTWSRDHRVHHKYSETHADPHNIKRGFFFAHMGWLCCRKHPDVKSKGKLIDMSDLEANPYVMFQHRHFWWMSVVFTVLLPTMVPVLLWQERFWTSFVLSFMCRYLITLHGTWLVNSAAHYYGHRPYDTRIEARESPYVIYNALGEGFHNYHHTFPYDYATSEFGRYMNITTAFIDLCAALGLVHDRRKVDTESVLKRRARTGDLLAGRDKCGVE